MFDKEEVRSILKEIGYEIGEFASNETLSNIIRLHSLVVTDKEINVAQLNDLELRSYLTQHGLRVGPITNITRSIYQRKLLEIFTCEIIEEQEEDQSEDNTFYTKSILKNSDSTTIRHGCYSAESATRDNYGDSNVITARTKQPAVKTNKDSPIKKVVFSDDPKDKNNQSQVAIKNKQTYLYPGITIFVAGIVFIFYLYFEK